MYTYRRYRRSWSSWGSAGCLDAIYGAQRLDGKDSLSSQTGHDFDADRLDSRRPRRCVARTVEALCGDIVSTDLDVCRCPGSYRARASLDLTTPVNPSLPRPLSPRVAKRPQRRPIAPENAETGASCEPRLHRTLSLYFQRSYGPRTPHRVGEEWTCMKFVTSPRTRDMCT